MVKAHIWLAFIPKRAGRGKFELCSKVLKSGKLDSYLWTSNLQFVAFDIPSQAALPFEKRMEILQHVVVEYRKNGGTWIPKYQVTIRLGSKFLSVVKQEKCFGQTQLLNKLEKVLQIGGEGLMLRKPGSVYESTRSPTLLKVKVREFYFFGCKISRKPEQLGFAIVKTTNPVVCCKYK